MGLRLRVRALANTNDPRSLAARFRARRDENFLRPYVERLFAASGPLIVLDVGGRLATWENNGLLDSDMIESVTIVNFTDSELVGNHGKARLCRGDATDLDFADASFDLVFSNSVIEHVGDASSQQAMATECLRVSRKGVFVQTPNKAFPVEPHFRLPFVHYLPRRVRAYLVLWTRLSHSPPTTIAEAQHEVDSVRLLAAREFERMFDTAEISIQKERLGLLTKSLIAVRQP